VPRKQDRPTLPLKNGSEVDAQRAYVLWQRLENAGGDQLNAFVDLATGQVANVSMRTRAELMTTYRGWFTDDGSLDPIAKNVIQSAVSDSADGKVVVTPFLLATQKEVDLLTGIHRRLTSLEADFMQELAEELKDKKHVSSVVRELRRGVRRIAKEAKNHDDPGYSKPR
jgi:hypothetical protein